MSPLPLGSTRKRGYHHYSDIYRHDVPWLISVLCLCKPVFPQAEQLKHSFQFLLEYTDTETIVGWQASGFSYHLITDKRKKTFKSWDRAQVVLLLLNRPHESLGSSGTAQRWFWLKRCRWKSPFHSRHLGTAIRNFLLDLVVVYTQMNKWRPLIEEDMTSVRLWFRYQHDEWVDK